MSHGNLVVIIYPFKDRVGFGLTFHGDNSATKNGINALLEQS